MVKTHYYSWEMRPEATVDEMLDRVTEESKQFIELAEWALRSADFHAWFPMRGDTPDIRIFRAVW